MCMRRARTGVEFRPALPRCSFVNRVPELRTLAANAFAGHTSMVESELRAHFVETRSFAEIWDGDRAAKASKALAKIMYEMQKLGRVWAPPVLPATSYALAIGGLLGKVAVSCCAMQCCAVVNKHRHTASSHSNCLAMSFGDGVQGWIVASVLRLAEEDLLCYKPGSLVHICPLALLACLP